MIEKNQLDLHYAVVADVGGTNSRFQLIGLTQFSTNPDVIKTSFYLTNKYPSLKEVMAEFLSEFVSTEKYPEIAVISIAGPVLDNKAKMANTIWPETDLALIAKDLNIRKYKLLNDFVAIGYSLLKVPDSELVPLNKEVKPIKGDIKGVIGPGTGLGECILFASPTENAEPSYYVKGGEGGHANFSARNELEWEWFNYLKNNFPDVGPVITVERGFCGPSIPYMYKFFAEKGGITIDIATLDSKLIMQAGIDNSDPIATKVLDLFLRLYGNEVGSFGIRYLPFGGLYLVGGLTSFLLDYLLKNPENEFVKSIYSKEPILNELLKKIPIYFVKYVELGLLGAFEEAQRLI